MKLIIGIGTGSFIGGVLRYLLSKYLQTKISSPFPVGTLTVNGIGCFLIGVIFGISDKCSLTEEWKLALGTGLCGGFTTFSAFSNETVGIIRAEQYLYALAYILASVVLGVCATFLGFSIVKLL